MLKVAHITPAFHPATAYGGPTESAYQLSAHLARRGVDVRVLTTDANGAEVLDMPRGVEQTSEPHLTVRYEHRVLREAVAPTLLAQLRPYLAWADVVHLNAIYNFTTFPTLAGCRALGKPLVWSARGALQGRAERTNQRVKSAWEGACRAIAPGRLVLHVTSQQEADESAPFFPRAQVAVIPNGVNVPDVLPPRTPRGEVLRIGSLGRLHPIKGLERLIEAAALARERPGMPRFRLLLAGEGDPAYANSLRALAASHHLAEQVQLVGPLRGDAKTRFLRELDLFVAPSIRENFGIAIAEALAHGTPVIASRGTPWQVLEESGAGFWVEGTPRAIADALVAAATAPLDDLGARARELVLQRFGWATVAVEMTRVYESLR